MTDDTDSTEHEDAQHTVSLPLLETFASLEAELRAKEERIERLENELATDFLDPEAAEEPPNDGTAAIDGTETAVNDDTESGTVEDRSPESWEPETDPLEDTGQTAVEESPNQGQKATAGTKTVRSSSDSNSDADPAVAESGFQPVRTASADSGTPPADAGGDEQSGTTSNASASEFGITVETRSNLTGGSLMSSPGGYERDSVASDERDSGGSDETDSGESDETDSADTDGEGRQIPPTDRGERLSRMVRHAELRTEEEVVRTFVRGITEFDDVTRKMLAHYRDVGDAAPTDAHVAANGSGERQYAYSRNRTLRKAGVIEHDGAGRYRYALPDLVEEAFDGHVDTETRKSAVTAIESATHLDE